MNKSEMSLTPTPHESQSSVNGAAEPTPGPADQPDANSARVQAIDAQVAHVWMVRTFLKHCDEAEGDDDLHDIVRDLYDFILALGSKEAQGDASGYLKQAKKKLKRLRRATDFYEEIQPEVSGHTNFAMAARSLRQATNQIAQLLQPGGVETKGSESD